MIKRFNEFNEEEQAYILKMNDSWFCAEMSDCYANTKREEEALLKAFNEKFGYNFSTYSATFCGKPEEIFFI